MENRTKQPLSLIDDCLIAFKNIMYWVMRDPQFAKENAKRLYDIVKNDKDHLYLRDEYFIILESIAGVYTDPSLEITKEREKHFAQYLSRQNYNIKERLNCNKTVYVGADAWDKFKSIFGVHPKAGGFVHNGICFLPSNADSHVIFHELHHKASSVFERRSNHLNTFHSTGFDEAVTEYFTCRDEAIINGEKYINVLMECAAYDYAANCIGQLVHAGVIDIMSLSDWYYGNSMKNIKDDVESVCGPGSFTELVDAIEKGYIRKKHGENPGVEYMEKVVKNLILRAQILKSQRLDASKGRGK